MIPNRVSINKRFMGASNRTRYGHFEADTIVSRKTGKGSLSVLVERKSRLVLVKKTKTMSSNEHSFKVKEIMKVVKVKSITFDNGIENRGHESLRVPTFFCDPYSSWQKGSVENANKMIRRYIPKGSDISKVSDEYIEKIVEIINKKPRKILGYRSALEVARVNGVLLNNS